MSDKDNDNDRHQDGVIKHPDVIKKEMEQEKAGNSPMLSSTHSIVFQLKNGEIILNRTERCPPPPFQKIY